jgi:hypothetical protein
MQKADDLLARSDLSVVAFPKQIAGMRALGSQTVLRMQRRETRPPASPAGCALATRGHETAAPPSRLMNSRRLMGLP